MSVVVSSQHSDYYFFDDKNGKVSKPDLKTLQPYRQNLLARMKTLEERQKTLIEEIDRSLSFSLILKRWVLIGAGFLGLAAYVNNNATPFFIACAVFSGYPSSMISFSAAASVDIQPTMDQLKTGKKLLKQITDFTLMEGDVAPFLKKVDDPKFELSTTNCKKANTLLQLIGKTNQIAQQQLEFLPLLENDNRLKEERKKFFLKEISPLIVWMNKLDHTDILTLKNRVKDFLDITEETCFHNK